jgi:hypothetical protein
VSPLAGFLLGVSTSAGRCHRAGAVKIAYDLSLLGRFAPSGHQEKPEAAADTKPTTHARSAWVRAPM